MELTNAIELFTRKIQQNNDENAVWQLALDTLKKDFAPELEEIENLKSTIADKTDVLEATQAQVVSLTALLEEKTPIQDNIEISQNVETP